MQGQKTGSTRNAMNLQLTESTSGLSKKQRRKPNADWIQESTLSSLVEKRVESSDTFSTDRSLTKRRSSVFNQLSSFRLERVFCRRSALLWVWNETRYLR